MTPGGSCPCSEWYRHRASPFRPIHPSPATAASSVPWHAIEPLLDGGASPTSAVPDPYGNGSPVSPPSHARIERNGACQDLISLPARSTRRSSLSRRACRRHSQCLIFFSSPPLGRRRRRRRRFPLLRLHLLHCLESSRPAHWFHIDCSFSVLETFASNPKAFSAPLAQTLIVEETAMASTTGVPEQLPERGSDAAPAAPAAAETEPLLGKPGDAVLPRGASIVKGWFIGKLQLSHTYLSPYKTTRFACSSVTWAKIFVI